MADVEPAKTKYMIAHAAVTSRQVWIIRFEVRIGVSSFLVSAISLSKVESSQAKEPSGHRFLKVPIE